MASLSVNVGFEFPAGSSVSLYSAVEDLVLGAPIPAAPIATTTVGSDSTVTFTGLLDGTQYVIGGLISGVWRYIGCRTPPVTGGGGGGTVITGPADVPGLVAQLSQKGPRGTVIDPAAYGAKGDVVVFMDGAITAGSTTFTSTTLSGTGLPGGSGSKKIYIDWAGAGTSVGTTSGALSTGSPISSIPRTAGAAVPPGPFVISSGSHGQVFTTAGAATNASIPVSPLTPNFAYPSGSALAINNLGLSTTISSMGSGTATLATAATQTVNGMVGWYGTDDTAAFKSIQGALTQGGTVSLDNKFYLLDGAPDQSQQGNAIFALPAGNIGATFEIYGPSGFQAGEVNGLTNGGIGGGGFATTRQGDTYSTTKGAPSMVGGPTDEGISGAGGGSGWPATGTLNIKNVTFLKPENPSIGSLDAQRCANLVTTGGGVRSKTAAQMLSYGTYSTVGQVPTNKNSFGVRGPGVTNAGTVILDNVAVYGEYVAFVLGEHNDLRGCYAQFSVSALAFDDRTANTYSTRLNRFGVYDCNYGMSGWDATNGVKSMGSTGQAYVEGTIDWESAVQQWTLNSPRVLDANHAIKGRILTHNNTFLGIDSTWGVQGGAHLIIKPLTPQVLPPTYDDVVLADAPLAYLPLGDAGSPAKGTTLSAALSTGSAITALPVAALTDHIPPGVISVSDATNFQKFITNTGALTGATSIPVVSQTPNRAYAIGTGVSLTSQVLDQSGNAHDGTVYNRALSALPGPQGQDGSIQFASANKQFVALDTLGGLGAGIGSCTIEFWMKTTTTLLQSAMGTYHNTTGTVFNVGLNQDANTALVSAGKLFIEVSDQGSANHRRGHVASAGIFDGVWHLVQIQPATTGSHLVWIDGVSRTVTMETTPGTLGTIANFANQMTLGVENNVGLFGLLSWADIRLSKVAFYSARLSAAKLALRYQNTIFRN